MTLSIVGERRPRTQAERSDATRQQVIDAALQVLRIHGYSGATIAAIRDAAGVSTGALNHQFSTKALLMAAVVQRYAEQRMEAYSQALSGAKDVRAGIEAVLDVADATIRLPETTAIFEIHLARRNDPHLDQLTKPVYDDMAKRIRIWISKVRRAAGFKSKGRFDHFSLLNFAVYRGLAMELIDRADDNVVNEALKLWRKAAIRMLLEND